MTGVEAVSEPEPAKRPDVTMLAENRTEMGFGRTLLALERTLMAWIRTDLSLISFGFTMFKFLDTMQHTSGSTVRENAPRNIGGALILIGGGTLIMAMFQFKVAMKRILVYTQTKPQTSISMIAGFAILLVALAMLLNMWGVAKF